MNNILELFKRGQIQELTDKEVIVERLLKAGNITAREAVTLLKTLEVNITADKLEMSTGAKIIGGSDFETKQY